ncbi:EAL domain-containing protein [Sphingosinicellaceae bacterium]|nr:EAL domain-containing protein [Sphingosinicellaceae bacterium]
MADLLLQRMASVVAASGVGVVRGRLGGGPRWANDAFLEMSGYRRSDLAGLSWTALTTVEPWTFLPGAPDDIAPADEHEFVRKDGSRWPVIVSRGVDPTDSAQLILFVVDLSASRLAEAARSAADVESEQRFRRLADDIPVIVWCVDPASQATYLSKIWYDYTGQTEAGALGRGWMKAVCREDLGRMMPLARCVAKGKPFDFDFRVLASDGTARWFMSSGRPRFDTAGRLVGFAGSLTDIHDRKLAERELADVQLRLSRALDGTGVGVWEWDAAADSVSVSGSALGLAGIASARESYHRVDYRAAIHPDDREHLLAAMAEYVEGRSQDFAVEVRLRRNNGGWIWVLDRGLATARDAQGRATRMVGTLTNIDDSKCAAERLRWTVDHDALTGLASRTFFNTRLEAALSGDRRVGLALLDIDDFKSVNDVHGHAAGDALLKVLAQRLADFAYPDETVARLGGDEFTLIIPDCGSAQRLTGRLEKLRSILSSPFLHEGETLTCRSSIGVAIAPGHGGDPSTLMRSADMAMYNAKAGAFGGVALYDPALGARMRRETAPLATVRAALDADTMRPLYEPIVRLSDGRLVGYEALAHVAGGDEAPVDTHEFEASFGDAELSIRLGACILDRALADFRSWRSAGLAPKFLAVNVTIAELRQGDYANRLLAKLAAHDFPPASLRIEIVENGLHCGRAGSASAATLAALRDGGMLVGLDKFGTGSSSLSHLSQLPLAAVKIDRQFVRGVAEPGSDRTIVRIITGLGATLGLRIVAVGVETAAQARTLSELGCTFGQGSWFGAPRDAAATLAQLQATPGN